MTASNKTLTDYTPKEIAKAVEALRQKNTQRKVKEWIEKHPEKVAVIKEKHDS